MAVRSGDQGRPSGNSTERDLDRLRIAAKTSPRAAELREDVLTGRMTPHAANVALNLKPKKVEIVPSKPDRVAAQLRKHMTPEDLAILRTLLED